MWLQISPFIFSLTWVENLKRVCCLDNREEKATAGDLLWTATVEKRQQLLDWLTNALLARAMVTTAASAACAAVDRGSAGDVAAALAPGLVGAVVAGRVEAVANVGHMVVALGYIELLVQLALALLRDGHRDTLGGPHEQHCFS